jgi:carbonic anhydrase/acetyltransferase-like protein (isoleucine patch superfamily)
MEPMDETRSGAAPRAESVTAGPFLLPYAGMTPRLAGVARAAPGAAVLGRVEAGPGLALGPAAAVRADGHYVRIGRNFRLGAHGTVHIAHELYPTLIGDGVSAGPGAVIHACDVADGCSIGPRAVILDGSRLGPGLALGADAVVFPRTTLEGGWLHEGAPAVPVRRLEPGELARLQTAWEEGAAADAGPGADGDGILFVAATAVLRGAVRAGGDVGIWFGCVLDAGRHGITIGDRTNIQDNSVIRAVATPVAIGEEATIGHNVTMTDCTVGARSLVGIGAVVAPGTVIAPDVLLAAGAATEPGQVLEGGWLWGGRPARRLKPLDEARRAIITGTWPRYVEYARAFAAAQAAASA